MDATQEAAENSDALREPAEGLSCRNASMRYTQLLQYTAPCARMAGGAETDYMDACAARVGSTRESRCDCQILTAR